MSTTLWDLGSSLEAIQQEIIDNYGELTPEIEAKLDALGGSFDEKATNVALAVTIHDGRAAEAKAHRDRLAKIVTSHERARDSLKRYLLNQMERVGRTEIENDRLRLRVQQNSRPVIRWGGKMEDAPEGFARHEAVWILDTDACYRAWKEGKLPPGFTAERGKHLTGL